MATRKAAIPENEKFEKQDLDLFDLLAAIDKKDYGYYSRLTQEQQKKFVPYMMLHWTSAVKGNEQVSKYYLLSTDMVANKHMFNEQIQDHPELQWLMLCASSAGIGKQFHQWIPHLSDKIGKLKDSAKEKDIKEYFEKIFKGTDSSLLKEYASEFTTQQNHKFRIARLYPDMKISDIDLLSDSITSDELDEYDKQSGL